jgi:hypothetical protein
MDETLVIALIVIIAALCIYINSRHLPLQRMRPMTFGDVGGIASQKVYYPRWADALRNSGELNEKTVINRCGKDPMCAAVAYTTKRQQASRIGEKDPERLSASASGPTFWPYTLDPSTNMVYYHPMDAVSGPDLFVKRNVELTSWYPEYEPTPKLIDPRPRR